MNQQPLERSLLFQDREYVDIDLNFTKARSTDIARKKGENAIKQALKILLLTGPAERLFHPELASGVRDLLFHVQEHRFTLLQLSEIMSNFNLEFLGFSDMSIKKKYSKLYSNDKKNILLDNWHKFEIDNIDAFSGMYNFWIRKKLL